ncbi:MAG: response regulator [candidate division NC10 bacterium]|nr:response regulator [candidate division NC10 bacterium]MBI2115411.1 response regulator [candidate division NC10 bacterium]MBI2457460.1 response regulator [candidate division NC10 bacterium]MBI2562790.1 response regulator [candidate division NC10 bacterium]MBI3084445.1 response regulator [candidate division NC10 bacterium]
MDSESEGECRNTDDRPFVLVLDPDPRVGEALVLALRRQAQVEWVGTGMAGLRIAAESPVNLVIAETHLPDMSARDFLHLLRVLQPRLPVALLGAATRPEEWGRDVADAHFPKPFDLKQFLVWIADCLAHRSAG